MAASSCSEWTGAVAAGLRLPSGSPANATTTMATFLINEGTKRSNYGIAGAASVVLFVIALTFALLYQRFILSRDNLADSPRKARR